MITKNYQTPVSIRAFDYEDKLVADFTDVRFLQHERNMFYIEFVTPKNVDGKLVRAICRGDVESFEIYTKED